MESQSAEINPAIPEFKPAGRRNMWLGYIVAALCLIWVFHDVHPGIVWSQMRAMQWGWAAVAIVLDVLAYVCQGLRWQLLLVPLGRTSPLKATEDIYAGLFVNEISPLRAGEALRIFLMARRLNVPMLSVFSTVTIERLFDGLWLALGIALVSFYVPLPWRLMRAADILDVILLLAVLVLLLLVLRRRAAGTPGDEATQLKTWRWISSLWRDFTLGLQQTSLSKSFFLAFAISSLVVLLQALSLGVLMRAYDMDVSFWVAAAVFLIVHLGTAIPNAPANIGAFQFFMVVGLSIFGVEKTLATGFSVIAFLLLTLPLLVLGFLAISHAGLSLTRLRIKAAS